MKSNELRIGNYVDLYGKIAQVQRSDFSETEHGIAIDSGKPIPLTEEWLLKFGFEKSSLKYWIICNKGFFFGISLKMGAMYLFDEGMITPHNIEYVHQLQNLYFALTGEELNDKGV